MKDFKKYLEIIQEMNENEKVKKKYVSFETGISNIKDFILEVQDINKKKETINNAVRSITKTKGESFKETEKINFLEYGSFLIFMAFKDPDSYIFVIDKNNKKLFYDLSDDYDKTSMIEEVLDEAGIKEDFENDMEKFEDFSSLPVYD